MKAKQFFVCIPVLILLLALASLSHAGGINACPVGEKVMRRKIVSDLLLAFVVMLALIAGSGLMALSRAYVQSSGYDLAWNTIDGGSCIFSAGSEYTLSGAIGQMRLPSSSASTCR